MRPSILLSFWRVHKCRQRILAALRPFAEHTRRQEGGRTDWEAPVPLGFLVTLITRRAQRVVGALAPDALGALQAELWAALTGLSPAAVGERIALLSASGDARFTEGSHRALLFDAALAAASAGANESQSPEPDDAQGRLVDRDGLFELWDRLLDDASPV